MVLDTCMIEVVRQVFLLLPRWLGLAQGPSGSGRQDHVSDPWEVVFVFSVNDNIS